MGTKHWWVFYYTFLEYFFSHYPKSPHHTFFFLLKSTTLHPCHSAHYQLMTDSYFNEQVEGLGWEFPKLPTIKHATSTCEIYLPASSSNRLGVPASICFSTGALDHVPYHHSKASGTGKPPLSQVIILSNERMVMDGRMGESMNGEREKARIMFPWSHLLRATTPPCFSSFPSNSFLNWCLKSFSPLPHFLASHQFDLTGLGHHHSAETTVSKITKNLHHVQTNVVSLPLSQTPRSAQLLTAPLPSRRLLLLRQHTGVLPAA